MIHVSRRDGDQQAQISHNFLTNLVGRHHRTQASILDNRWTMTCEYGLRRTGQTLSIDLPIRRLGFESLRARLAQRPSRSSAALQVLGCVPSSSADQWPSRGHRVKNAYGVACDRFATRDPPTAHQDSRHEEDGQGIRTET